MENFKSFKKLEVRMGTIVEAEGVEDIDKVVKLTVDLGNETRRLVAGVAPWYKPEDLKGKQVPLLINLDPEIIREIVSQGMILVAVTQEKAILLRPEKENEKE